jgi:hypothetical protein
VRTSWFFAVLVVLARPCGAVVVEQEVTPASLKQPNSRFAVKVEQGEDGLIHFTITYRAAQQQYLVAHVEVRHDEKLVSKTDVPSVTHGPSSVFYLALSPDCLSGSRFELAERSFGLSMDGSVVPLPGGIDYQFRLPEFAAHQPEKDSP